MPSLPRGLATEASGDHLHLPQPPGHPSVGSGSWGTQHPVLRTGASPTSTHSPCPGALTEDALGCTHALVFWDQNGKHRTDMFQGQNLFTPRCMVMPAKVATRQAPSGPRPRRGTHHEGTRPCRERSCLCCPDLVHAGPKCCFQSLCVHESDRALQGARPGQYLPDKDSVLCTPWAPGGRE